MEPVLVITHTRGVFFGYLAAPEDDHSPQKLTLTNARNAVFWDTDTKGVFALAADGPNASCRVGPSVPTITLFGITTVAVCTPEAVTAWETGPWHPAS